MANTERQLILGAEFHQSGDHEGAWRLPTAQPERSTDISYFQELSQVAERGKFDFVFFADFLAYRPSIRYSVRWAMEPISLLAAVSAVTERIGLVATGSTVYTEPYNLARTFATLDHISGGRAAWNIVTSGEPAASRDFGEDHPPSHHDRYVRAREFVEVVTGLWDSWEDDAIVADRTSGTYANPAQLHELRHRGANLSVAGALNLPRPPQGHPVLVQAGSSDDGRSFAARYAEIVFTAQPTVEAGQAFYSDIKSRVQAVGRSRDSIKIIPGFLAVIGSTEEEAKRLKNDLDDLLLPEVYAGLLSSFGIRLDGLDLDSPLPEKLGDVSNFNGIKSRLAVIESLVAEWGGSGKLTIRELVRRLAGSRGHVNCVGTPEQVADKMETWFRQNAADGFIVKSSHLPGCIETFVEEVVPILQRRGIYRTEYAGTTLREHLGLERPENSFTQPGHQARQSLA